MKWVELNGWSTYVLSKIEWHQSETKRDWETSADLQNVRGMRISGGLGISDQRDGTSPTRKKQSKPLRA